MAQRVKWVIDDNCRVDLVFYSGLSCSGDQSAVRITPGGTNGEVEYAFQSMRMFASPGLRVYVCDHSGDDWREHAWRCIRVVKGVGKKTNTRRRMLNVHDVDLICDPSLFAQPHGSAESFPIADEPTDDECWTFGQPRKSLKNRVRMVRVVKES